jgi:methylmalonyl-CoA mutase cobalamin-binding domain/chain
MAPAWLENAAWEATHIERKDHMADQDKTLKQTSADLHQAMMAADTAKGVQLARDALAAGSTPTRFFVDVLQPILYEIGKRFERLEIFLPELMKAAKVAKAIQAEVLEPALRGKSGEGTRLGNIVIGTCKGDIHDIGKNMVALMLQVNGFKVIDLGTDVSPQAFIDAARENDATIIAMSSLLTTSMPYMGDLTKRLEGLGLRKRYQVIVGGAPVTQAYADRIGANAYGADAISAVKQCLLLTDLPSQA